MSVCVCVREREGHNIHVREDIIHMQSLRKYFDWFC